MEKLSEEEQEQLREILRTFFSDDVDKWKMNLRGYELLIRLLQKSQGCSKALDLVPRPFMGGNPVKWVSKQVRKAVLRFFTRDENKPYLACLVGAAIGMKTEFIMAGRGI